MAYLHNNGSLGDIDEGFVEDFQARTSLQGSLQRLGEEQISYPANAAILKHTATGIDEPDRSVNPFNYGGLDNQTFLPGKKNETFCLEPQEHEDNCRALDRDYDTSEKRLKSYETFPICAQAKPRELADNGLYYIGVADKVKCAYCRGMLYNWEEEDDPLEEHHRHFPACPFIIIRYKRLKETPQEKPEDIYKSPTMVLNTQKKNVVPNTPVVPKVESNKAKIVGIVKGFGYEDDIVERAYNVLAQKGESDIKSNAVLDVIFDIEENPDKYSGDVAYAAGAVGGQIVQGAGEPPSNVNTTQTVPKQTISLSNPQQSNTAQFASSNMLRQMPAQYQPTLAGANMNAQNNAENVIAKSASSTTLPSANKAPADPTRIKELKDEQTKLKQNVICNICKKDKINTLFLPCRHLVACEDCSADMNDCSRCSKRIIGTVKIFMP